MTTVAQHLAFAPPAPAGMLRSLTLAVLVHLLLLAALTWGISWNHRAQEVTVQAELWSALPQQAAPKPVEVKPAPVVVEPPPKPQVKDAQIVTERDKRREAQKKLETEQARKLELQKRELAEIKEKQLTKERALQLQRRDQAEKQREEELQAKRQEVERADNIRRMLGQAGISSNANASGSAERSAGPSASYAGRIRARIKPNIVYGDDKPGNPVAEVELRTAPDGAIIGRKLLKSSGQPAWDEAVLKAIDKTETLPRDVDGQVPSLLVIIFRPKE